MFTQYTFFVGNSPIGFRPLFSSFLASKLRNMVKYEPENSKKQFFSRVALFPLQIWVLLGQATVPIRFGAKNPSKLRVHYQKIPNWI